VNIDLYEIYQLVAKVKYAWKYSVILNLHFIAQLSEIYEMVCLGHHEIKSFVHYTTPVLEISICRILFQLANERQKFL
jgi:hypothetical protein